MRDIYFKLYDELPPPIAERAKRNFGNGDYSRYNPEPRSVRDAIDSGFYWVGVPEGRQYWVDAYNGRMPSTKNLPPLE